MKVSYTILILLLFSVIFTLWPGVSQFDSINWETEQLTQQEYLQAIENAKKYKYLNSIGYYKKPFPFSDITVSMEQYVWLITERVKVIVLLILAISFLKRKEFTERIQDEKALMFAILLFTFDLVDHLLTYNEPYYGLVSANIIIFTAWIGYMFYERWNATRL